MGGPGSGRHWGAGVTESTEDYRQIDVRHWQREGLLVPGGRFGWTWLRNGESIGSIRVAVETDAVIVVYQYRRSGEDWQEARCPVRLDWTACRFGGRRAWLRCPARGCRRRVAILYVADRCACRSCLGLTYPSQGESELYRAIRRAGRIRERLGWSPGLFDSGSGKPRGMRRTTFEGLVDEHDAIVATVLAGMRRRFSGAG